MTLITCINCPVGCRMQVTLEDGAVKSVTGHMCKRGLTYADQEAINPLRMVTAVVRVKGSPMPLSVKTKTPIPKAKIFDCMKEIESLKVAKPVKMGQVLISDVCGSGVPVVATKEMV